MGWDGSRAFSAELKVLSIISAHPELFSLGDEKGNKANNLPECSILSFMWDSTGDDGLQSNKTKLLALAQSHDLFVYEFSVENGKHNPNSLHSCKEETLKKLLEAKSISE